MNIAICQGKQFLFGNFYLILFFPKLFFALFLLFFLQNVKLDVTPFSDFRHNISLTPSRTDLGKMERSMLQGGHGKAAQSSQNNQERSALEPAITALFLLLCGDGIRIQQMDEQTDAFTVKTKLIAFQLCRISVPVKAIQ